jgi:hypothetical protein
VNYLVMGVSELCRYIRSQHLYIYEMMRRFTLHKISEIRTRLLRNDGSTQTIREEDKRRIQLDQKVDVFAYYNGCSLFENT